MRVVYVFDRAEEERNSSEWRCSVPARAINRTRLHRAELLSLDDFSRDTPAAKAACDTADVLVIERDLFGPILPAIQHWKARDKIVIADFDAAYSLLPATNPDFEYWRLGRVPTSRPGGRVIKQEMNPLPLTQFKWGLRMVNGATVPSPLLVDDWRSYTDIRYVPNYIDLEKYLNITPQPHEGVILGWGGSNSHPEVFKNSGLATALRRVCQLRPHVRVMVCGNHMQLLDELGLPEGQTIHKPWIPYSEWAKHLCQYDIGLAPLSGEYDDRRSWIRVLEFMVMRIPWIASTSPAYQQLSPFGWLVKNSPSDWEDVLLDMVDHLADYKAEAAGEPYFFGIGQSIDEHIDRVLDTYTSISNRAFIHSAAAASSFQYNVSPVDL